MKVLCKYNDPQAVPEFMPNDFDFGLELNEQYIVMGIALFRNESHEYYLVDTNGRPSWFPSPIFEIQDNSLPINWFIRSLTIDDGSGLKILLGFNELCNDIDYYSNLLNREQSSLKIYFQRKIEAESLYNGIDI